MPPSPSLLPSLPSSLPFFLSPHLPLTPTSIQWTQEMSLQLVPHMPPRAFNHTLPYPFVLLCLLPWNALPSFLETPHHPSEPHIRVPFLSILLDLHTHPSSHCHRCSYDIKFRVFSVLHLTCQQKKEMANLCLLCAESTSRGLVRELSR